MVIILILYGHLIILQNKVFLPTPHILAHSNRPGLVYVTPSEPHTGLYSDVTGHVPIQLRILGEGVLDMGGEDVDTSFLAHSDDLDS